MKNYDAFFLATSSTRYATSRITALIDPTIPEMGACRLPIIPAIISGLDGKAAIVLSCDPS